MRIISIINQQSIACAEKYTIWQSAIWSYAQNFSMGEANTKMSALGQKRPPNIISAEWLLSGA